MNIRMTARLLALIVFCLTGACQPQSNFLAVNESPSDISDFRRTNDEDLRRARISSPSDQELNKNGGGVESNVVNEDESVSISTMISGSYLTACVTIESGDEVICDLNPAALETKNYQENNDLKIAVVVTEKNTYRKINYRVQHERVDQTWELKIEPQAAGLSLRDWTNCEKNCNWKSELGDYDILLKIDSSHYKNSPLSIVLANQIRTLVF